MARLKGTKAGDLLKGTSSADDIYGFAGNDQLYGYGGNDEIEGGDGNDHIDGGSGHDDLEGGRGNDTLIGGSGNDEMEGGGGKDVFVYSSGRDEISDFNLRDDTLSLDKSLGIGSFSELLSKAKIVDDGEDVLFTFSNGKTLTLEDVDMKSLKAEHFGFKAGSEPLPTPGDEKLIGTAGNDTIYGHGGHDELDGGAGNDALYGGSGNDDLEGSAGHDRLDGGSGRNELEGGSGADTFVFSTGITEIEDFRAGTDKVELSKFLGVSNFSDMMTFATAINGGEDVRIDFGNAVLIFEDTTLTELKSSDFFFV